jgi:hypothetical protein
VRTWFPCTGKEKWGLWHKFCAVCFYYRIIHARATCPHTTSNGNLMFYWSGLPVVNSCRARYEPRPKEILSRRKLGYQTGRRCLTCWRKSPWGAVNDKGRNVAGRHSSRPAELLLKCHMAFEYMHWSRPWATPGFMNLAVPCLLLTLLELW